MAENGYIKLHRKLLQWKYYNDPVMLKSWLWILLHAEWQETERNGNAIHPGEAAFKYRDMMADLQLSHSQVMRVLKRLKDGGDLTTRPSKPPTGDLSFCIVTICKWSEYQANEDTARPNTRPNTRPNDVPNEKEVSPTPLSRKVGEELRKKEKPTLCVGKKKGELSFAHTQKKAALEERKRRFMVEVYAAAKDKMAGELVDGFIGHWTQEVEETGEMLFEVKRRTQGFSMAARLKKWEKTEWYSTKTKTKTKTGGNQNKLTSEQRNEAREQREQHMSEEELRVSTPEGYTVITWMKRLKALRDEGNDEAALLLSRESENIPTAELQAMKKRLA